ncbi:MAG: beta-lactamase family protein [Bacteroidales bacterium]|jgi:CubicO group peptidase (beta-lactamase class C family)|nr:beta-lactamase family protein [Bacteroidales bacterium]
MRRFFYVALLLFLTLQTDAQCDAPVRSKEDTTLAGTQLIDFANSLTPRQYYTFDSLLNVICQKLNGVLLVAIDDSVIYCRSAGYLKLYSKAGYPQYNTAQRADMRRKKSNAITPDTFFELASLSKQFTAAAVLKLVSEEKLSLQDTLRHFFPKLPYQNITIHHLLSHTSGLPEYFNFKLNRYDTSNLLTNNELVNVLTKYRPKILFQPGTQYQYINTNYALLAAIVALVSDMKFETYVRQNLFLPAGMSNTFFITEKSLQNQAKIATGHLRSESEVKPYFMDGTMGDKGIYSNVLELFKWYKAYFLDYKILPKEWVEYASQQENCLFGVDSMPELYGYGLRLKVHKKYGYYIYHGGLWRGYNHVWIYRPSDRFYAIFLSNFVNGGHRGRTLQLMQIKDK